MYDIWPLIIISLALIVAIIITLRHFPALAVLDVDNIPEEKERQTKEKIIQERIKRKFKFFDKIFKKINDFFSRIFQAWEKKLKDLKAERRHKKEELSLEDINLEDRIKILLNQAKVLAKQESWDEAEKKLIEVIKLDDKNFLAFWDLGEVYHSQDKYQEAKQTLLYTLKLTKTEPEPRSNNEVANINHSLCLINQSLGDLDQAKLHLEESLSLDAKNPRYLDLMLNLCIMKKDKLEAGRILDRIIEVNPDNNNISDWKKQIEAL